MVNKTQKKKEVNEYVLKLMIYLMTLLVLLLIPSLISLILNPGFSSDFWIVFADGLVLILVFALYVGLKVYVKRQGEVNVEVRNY